MPLIQDPTIARRLQTSLRLTSLPDSILAPEVVPVILVADETNRLGDQVRGCAGMGTPGAVAAQNATAVLTRQNPTYELVCQRIWISTGSSGLYMVFAPTLPITGLTDSGNTSFTDMMTAGRPASPLGVGNTAGVPAGRVLHRFDVAAGRTERFETEIRVGQAGIGDGLSQIAVICNTANVAATIGFDWVESPPLG
jgi:hypothetical protein